MALQTIFVTKTVLFIGTSLNDYDVKSVLETMRDIFKGQTRSHYALVPEERAGDLETRFWKKFYNIELLRYRDHSQVDQFLEDLKVKVKSNRPSLGYEQQILEAKWYPSDQTIENIQRAIHNQVPIILNCGGLEKEDTLEEANILFDTPKGILYESKVNLSIKILASKDRGKVTKLRARWVLIKLQSFLGDPEKMWNRNQEPQKEEKEFSCSDDARRDVERIIKALRQSMPQDIIELLKKENVKKRADLKPAVIIAVHRHQWFFRPKGDGEWKPRLFISDVNIHPYSYSWIEKLPPEFIGFQSTQHEKEWSWRELEIEDEENRESGSQRDHSLLLGNFERIYQLKRTDDQARPIAKYHNAVKVLRKFYKSQESDISLFDGWLPFLKKGD